MENKLLETGVDKLVRIVKERRKVALSRVAKELGIDKDVVHQWAEFLEEEGVLSCEYGMKELFIAEGRLSNNEIEVSTRVSVRENSKSSLKESILAGILAGSTPRKSQMNGKEKEIIAKEIITNELAREDSDSALQTEDIVLLKGEIKKLKKVLTYELYKVISYRKGMERLYKAMRISNDLMSQHNRHLMIDERKPFNLWSRTDNHRHYALSLS